MAKYKNLSHSLHFQIDFSEICSPYQYKYVCIFTDYTKSVHGSQVSIQVSFLLDVGLTHLVRDMVILVLDLPTLNWLLIHV